MSANRNRWSVKRKLALGAFTAVTAVTTVGLMVSIPTKVVHYDLFSTKVTSPAELLVISDLHSCDYGVWQRDLLNMVEEIHPDAVLFTGDIIDDILPQDNAITVLKWAAERYPSYYVTGNHEYWAAGDIQLIKNTVTACGVTVLEGTSAPLTIGDSTLQLCGVDDTRGGVLTEQLEQLDETSQTDYYRVLLAHRPECIEEYTAYPFDLVVSGHAHGGQWRLPYLMNGLLAPNQGFFPKYAGGQYRVNDADFIVSRGLARESTRIPRIYNPPELVVISVTGNKE